MAHCDPGPAQPQTGATPPDDEGPTDPDVMSASTRDLVYRPAGELCRMLEGGVISARDLLAAIVERVEARNGAINVVVTMDVERAQRVARQIDDLRAAGDPEGRLGPLAGLPITIKDSLMVAGVRTTSGAPELSDFVPDHDADSVAALKRAGVVVYGKTNLPLYAGDVQSYNDVFGTSNNPWDLSRTVGGSSGGSAGALAAGFTALEIGSDIAGSIRNPAAMCGVVGHKPSYGIVSGRGQIPGPPGTYTEADIAVIGPMARTVEDCAMALELIVGPNGWNAPAWSLRLPPARRREPAGLRVAVWATDEYCPVDSEIEAAIVGVGRNLEQAGAVVDFEARPSGFDFAKADATFLQLLGGALSGGWKLDELEAMAEDQKAGRPVPGGLGVEGATLRHRAWLAANERRLQMRARWREFFQHWDVVLAPIAPTVAIPHDHSQPMSSRTIEVAGEIRPYDGLMQWMGLFGLVYLPATAVPLGPHSTGLPMALQVVGPFLEDHTALAAAAMVEAVTGGFRPPPGW